MNLPDISIIIATRNREKLLWETIEKACVAIDNKPAEIIVVNDGDSALTIPASFSNKIRFFDNPVRGVSSARNFGASKANGSVFFFIDDDMWINKEAIDWIQRFLLKAQNSNAVYNMNWEYPSSLNEQLTATKVGQYLLQSKYNTMWGRMHAKGNQPESGLYKFHGAASGSLVMDKKIFEMIGGYDSTMIFQGEDISLSNKLNAMAIPVYVVFEITLYHNQQDRLSINAYLKRNSEGFESEFRAVKAGSIKPSGEINYHGPQKIVFEFFRFTEKAWIFLLRILPNKNISIAFNNRLIGMLTGLQRYKQWKKMLG